MDLNQEIQTHLVNQHVIHVIPVNSHQTVLSARHANKELSLLMQHHVVVMYVVQEANLIVGAQVVSCVVLVLSQRVMDCVLIVLLVKLPTEMGQRTVKRVRVASQTTLAQNASDAWQEHSLILKPGVLVKIARLTKFRKKVRASVMFADQAQSVRLGQDADFAQQELILQIMACVLHVPKDQFR